MILLPSADYLQRKLFSKNSFRNTIRVSNGLDQSQDQHYFSTDLSPNCLQRLSADENSRGKQ